MSFNGLDIFGVPLEYATEISRKKRWSAYIATLSESTKIDISRTFKNSIYEIYRCVFLGFLSFKSASYFLLGRFTPLQDDYLRTFNDFLSSSEGMSISKIHVIWQGKQIVVPANSFVFPLAEQGCECDAHFDFSQERERYYKSGKVALREIQLKLFLDSFDDLPPENAEMPSTY